MKKRKCGPCEVCCTALHIGELNKPKHTKCKSLKDNGNGCSMYRERPRECREFQCVWTYRDIPKAFRPDKTGILAYYVDSQFGPTLFMTETAPGAYTKSPGAKTALLELAENKNIAAIIAEFDGTATAMVP